MIDLNKRIHIIGNSCSGKSTLAARLAEGLNSPFVELDALNWLPNWVGLNATDPEEFERRIAAATKGENWVVAGSYMGFSQRVFWPRTETIVWLDLPRRVLVLRMLRRSWRRSRDSELLWGTNYEKFLPNLKVWQKDDSLLWWIWTQHRPKQQDMEAVIADPQWSHIQFIRLTTQKEIDQFLIKVTV